MNVTKEQIIGFTGSAILCLTTIFILSCIFLCTKEINQEQEEEILVDFEMIDETPSSFKFENQRTVKKEIPRVRPVPQKNIAIKEKILPSLDNQNPMVTQNNEQTIALEAERERALEAERERALEAERKKKILVNQQVSNAFRLGERAGKNEDGVSTKMSDKNSMNESASAGSYAGSGVHSNFDLQGRFLREGSLYRPSYDDKEEGCIVVEITVNSQGNVIRAEVALKGTNIGNSSMRYSAVEAAKKNKFNIITGQQNQIGTITYRYALK